MKTQYELEKSLAQTEFLIEHLAGVQVSVRLADGTTLPDDSATNEEIEKRLREGLTLAQRSLRWALFDEGADLVLTSTTTASS